MQSLLPLVLLWSSFLFSCAGLPQKDKESHILPNEFTKEELLNFVLKLPVPASSVSGPARVSLQSKSWKGQFRSLVLIPKQDELHFDVLNFLGGSLLRLDINQGQIHVAEGLKDESLKQQLQGLFKTFPAYVLARLFLGAVPEAPMTFSIQKTTQGDLLFTDQKESYRYCFLKNDGGLKLSHLFWERNLNSPESVIEFKFFNFDPKSTRLLDWELRDSSGQRFHFIWSDPTWD